METYKTGFIGCGNMASAIIGGILNNEVLHNNNIYVYDKEKEKCNAFGGIHICDSIDVLAKEAQIIFLCVKPNIVPEVLKEIRVAGKAIISIAAGVKTKRIADSMCVDARMMRIMPNTPLMVGKGAIGVQTPNTLTPSEREFIYCILEKLGVLEEVSEGMMDAVTGVSGSGPAYVYLFVDALARAGESNGLDYDTALALSIQTFEGACEMLKTSSKNAEQLIRDVCSPGGTTLEAMNVFEKYDTRGIIKCAVDACVKRSKELSE